MASLFIVGEAQAQMPLHLAAGPTLGTISTDDPDFEGAETSLGFFAAVGTSFPVGETVAVSPYLGYVQKGAKFGDGQFTFSYDYIEIPVLISTWFPVGETMSWSIFAGPQIGFQINCDEDGFDCSELDSRKGTEFGVMAGTGLQFSDALSVGVGADIGMTDLFDTGGDSFKTRTYWLSLGYSTSLGGSNGNGM
ncbi:MAG: porin family protein [Gemmatimonadota bacterium]